MTRPNQTIIPVLRIFDLAAARAFYLDYLGFKIDWQHQFGENFPLYLQISKADLILQLSQHHGDVTPGSYIRIWMQDLEGFALQLQSHDYRFAKPALQHTEWETLELSILDPFSNRLCFWHDLEL